MGGDNSKFDDMLEQQKKCAAGDGKLLQIYTLCSLTYCAKLLHKTASACAEFAESVKAICHASKEKQAEEGKCENKDSWACFDLGQLYEFGVGVERNFANAAESYEFACADKHWRACTGLAKLISRGRDGVPADPERAVGLFGQSCLAGYGESCLLAGKAHQNARQSNKAFAYVDFACMFSQMNTST